MRNYTENADSLLEQYPTKTMPLSKQEEKRIYDMALKKIEKAGSYTPPKLKKHRRVPVCVAAAVAATCVLSAGIAAAPYIKELASGKIGFFTDAKSQAQVQNVLDAPRRWRKSASSGLCSAADTMRTKAVPSRCRCNKKVALDKPVGSVVQ